MAEGSSLLNCRRLNTYRGFKSRSLRIGLLVFNKVLSFFILSIYLISAVFLYTQTAINNSENTNEMTTNYFGITNTINITNDEPAILQDIRNMEERAGASTTGMFIRAIIGFIVTLAGIYLVFIYFKKRTKKISGSDEIINVLATTPVATNRYISIVEIADEMYLIAIADHNITLLSKIEDKETKDQIKMLYANSRNNIVEDNFKTILDKMLSNFRQPKVKEENPIESTKNLRERLEKLHSKKEDKIDK